MGHTHRDHLLNAHDLSDSIDDIMSVDYWEPRPPTKPQVAISDHGVPLLSPLLQNKTIALLVCGGIAAMKAPLLARELRKHGASVTAFVSQEALRYVTEESLAWSTNQKVVTALSAYAEHLSDPQNGRPFDAFLLAPATYNTLNKFAAGIADNLLTTVLASALGRVEQGEAHLLVAPTMHGSMHTQILTDHLKRLQNLGVHVIPPRDAYGKHNLPTLDTLAHQVARELGKRPLSGVPILVTGGPTPVALDDIRLLTNRFTGRLSYAIAKAFYLAGADVHWVLGQSAFSPPDWLPHYRIASFQEYVDTVVHLAQDKQCQVGVFSAAVADYAPEEPHSGKYPSGAHYAPKLVATPKVIQKMRQSFPDMYQVSFKLESHMSYDALIDVAKQRLRGESRSDSSLGSDLVVANCVQDQGHDNTPQQAWLVGHKQVKGVIGKSAIAEGIVDHVKQHFLPGAFLL